MKTILLLVMGLMIMGVANATVYNITAGNCRDVGNDSYCAPWPTMNINQTLDPGTTYRNDNMNITVYARTSPINENLSLNFGESKNYPTYNLSISCVDAPWTNMTLNVNTSQSNDVHRVRCDCGIGKQAVDEVVSKDMNPGEAWYNIRCLPLLKPINGTIILEPNETFVNKSWTFSTDGGNCTVAVSPTAYFVAKMDYEGKYLSADNEARQCQAQLAESNKTSDNFLMIIAIVGICGGAFAFMWFRENKGGQFFNFPEPGKFRKMLKDKQKREEIVEDMNVEPIEPVQPTRPPIIHKTRDREYYEKKFFGGKK